MIIFVVVMAICDVHPLSTEREKEGGEVLWGLSYVHQQWPSVMSIRYQWSGRRGRSVVGPQLCPSAMATCDVHPLSTEREKEGGEVLWGLSYVHPQWPPVMSIRYQRSGRRKGAKCWGGLSDVHCNKLSLLLL